jgi:hypothetical protein
MALNTHSKLIYGFTIDSDNFALDFDEGIGEIQASIDLGDYTFGEIADEVAAVLTDAGTQEYTVTIDRETRFVTISATSNFDLLVATGSRFAKSIFGLLGFTISDRTGSNSYTSNVAAGFEYATQMKLQDYISSEEWRRAASAVVNKSASGLVEVVKFGDEKFIQANFRFITDRDMGSTPVIRTNLNGKQDFLDFIRFMVTKGFAEFFPNEDDVNIFEKVLLESTPGNSDGTGYQLDEQYGRGLPDFYDSGRLVFRVVES